MGYKLAHPVLSADGARVGFTGVSLGGSHVYGVVGEAICVLSPRHHPPVRYCDCGFYCFGTVESASALACDARFRSAVLLEVLLSGRYIRYEEGLRGSRQRIRTMRVGRCPCGRAADVLVDAGTGQTGWRRLVGACTHCAGWRPAVTLDGFARLAGHDLEVRREEAAPAEVTGAPAFPAAHPDDETDPDRLVPLLAAEAALLQARLDTLQEQLDRLSHPRG